MTSPSTSPSTAPTCGPTATCLIWTTRAGPTRYRGVPPDYFSETGQLWGNPLYRWDRMAQRGYDWWRRRLRRTLALVDRVRLDHFRAFEAYWAVPGGR